jgi:trehalose utilization protein
MIKVAVYNEYLHEKMEPKVAEIYPEGIHGQLKKVLSDEFEVSCYTLDNVNEITEEVLENTDVLVWWGHMGHHKVPDEVAERVRDAVQGGMGLVALHSAHHSKPFKLLMGTKCNLLWRENGDCERVWNIKPSHPIAQGIGDFIYLEHEETYGEPFGIPDPDEIVFIASYEGGEVFRAGCCFTRELGRIFYFQPGHETYPIYYNEEIIRVIKNAINWTYSPYRKKMGIDSRHVKIPTTTVEDF